MPQQASSDTGTLERTINTYFPYLVEIRRRLLLAVCLMIVAAVLGFVYYDRIVMAVVGMLKLQGINIVFTSPFQYIELAMSSALLIGLVSAIPFIIWQLLSFLRPALRPGEYRLVLFMLPLSVILFVLGFGFGLVIMKYVVVIFQQNASRLAVGNFLDISKLLSAILATAGLMGMAFQFPVVLSVLVRFGIISLHQLIKQRPWAWLTSFFFAVLLPPTDILSAVLLTLPLVILFELTLLLNWIVAKRQSKPSFA